MRVLSRGGLSQHAIAAAALLCCAPAMAPARAWAQAPADNAAALQQRALQEAQAGQNDAAIRDYKQLLAAHPDWKEGWWNLGTLQYTANQFADAAATFRHVTGFAPKMGLAWALQGLSEFETGDTADALADLTRAQSLGMHDDPETERVALFHLALLQIQHGDSAQATELLKATFGQATSPQVKYALGLALLHVPLLPAQVDPSREASITAAGDLAAASDAEALARFPGFLSQYRDLPFTHAAYASLLQRAGRAAEAAAQMRDENRVERAHPNVASLYRNAAADGTAAAASGAGASGTGAPAGSGRPSNDTAGLWRHAMQAFSQGDYQASMADLKQVLAAQPGNGTAWAVLGLSEFHAGEFGNARIHLQRGQSLGLSGSAQAVDEANYTLGLLLLHDGEFDAATDALLTASHAMPDDARLAPALGLALLRQPIWPKDAKASDADLLSTAGRISVLLHASKYDEAFALFKPLLAAHPQTPFLHYAYGTALLALSEFDDAAREMRVETAISPKSPLPYVRLASIAVRQHHPADAVPEAQKALALAPNDADAHYLLGRASLESGDLPTALRELEIAAKLSPNSPEVHYNLARAYARDKRTGAAEQERATFARLNAEAEARKAQDRNQSDSGAASGAALP